jgi:hypothetical protein
MTPRIRKALLRRAAGRKPRQGNGHRAGDSFQSVRRLRPRDPRRRVVPRRPREVMHRVADALSSQQIAPQWRSVQGPSRTMALGQWNHARKQSCRSLFFRPPAFRARAPAHGFQGRMDRRNHWLTNIDQWSVDDVWLTSLDGRRGLVGAAVRRGWRAPPPCRVRPRLSPPEATLIWPTAHLSLGLTVCPRAAGARYPS